MSSLTPDLYALKREHGGTVYKGGRMWIGPGPGHSWRDRSLSVLLTDEGRLVAHSFAGDSVAECAAFLGIEPGRASPPDTATRERIARSRAADRERRRELAAACCAAVWRGSVALEGSPGARYWEARGIGWFPDDVRFHPAAPRGYQSAASAPALVALARSVTGAPMALQSTFLTPDGRARIGRATFGALAGAAVQTGAPGPTLAVGEGLETCASFAELEGVPTWATLGTANLAAFTPPGRVRRLIIAADADPAGMKAARALAERVRSRCEVTISPAPEGFDWNDVMTGKAHV